VKIIKREISLQNKICLCQQVSDLSIACITVKKQYSKSWSTGHATHVMLKSMQSAQFKVCYDINDQ